VAYDPPPAAELSAIDMSGGRHYYPPHVSRSPGRADSSGITTADRVITLDFPNTVSDTGNGEHP